MLFRSPDLKSHKLLLGKAALIGFFDVFAIITAFFLALWIRFEFSISGIPAIYLAGYLKSIWWWSLVSVTVFAACGLYSSVWVYAGVDELFRIILAYFVLTLIGLGIFVLKWVDMPRSFYAIGIILSFAATVVIRFSYRMIRVVRDYFRSEKSRTDRKNVMIIGAGEAGRILMREFENSSYLHNRVACFIDDNPAKYRRRLGGIPIVGTRDDIPEAVEKYDISEIIFAIPSANAQIRKEILDICSTTGCHVQVLPGVYQIINQEVSLSNLRDVDPQDLLGRDPVEVDEKDIFTSISGKVVMVTGGGGSIGSELCRQIAKANPKTLIIFDIYENNAYDIQLELKRNYPELDLITLIGSVRDSRKIFRVFETYHPDIVYHAAAHKHVPLMEDSPCEAIKNNTIGTYKTAFAAMAHGCRRFVLISTDKAVNPTNIMGASKRMCEMVIQAFDHRIREGKADQIPQLFTHWMEEVEIDETVERTLREAKTEFVAVRFGNVLGSNGSVIPLFKKQIENGGPVTVTHPDIIRYFMTIPEAVSLVLQAGNYAHGGEIFVLDMGDPVKIDTLARNLIRLSGYTPDVDIKVEYVGLRPGEKLYEEKLMAEEGLKTTANKMIHIGQPIPFDVDHFLEQLDELMQAAYQNRANIRDLVREMVSTYHSADTEE